MTEVRTERRLVAILAADVVGYTKLIEQDEAGTVTTLLVRRREILEPLVAMRAGRIFKVTGDGVLIEFASAVNAVECAIEFQERMADANEGIPEDRQIVFRIGVSLGDVLVEDGDLYGDGVNIAARLEAIAEPGGIIVSDAAYQHVKNKANARFEDIGAQSLKNVSEPVQAYRIAGTSIAFRSTSQAGGDRPSIALLPFVNMSGDPAQDCIADGITENVIAGLSRFRDLVVIASNSTFAYKGRATRTQDVARELGVVYLLEGSVQKSGTRLRITAQLIDGTTGRHLWSERYERGMEDVFAVQDEVTEMIVATLASAYGGRLGKAWRGRLAKIGPADFRAYDHFQRGMELFNHYTRQDVSQARDCFQKAIALDPNYSRAYAKIAWAHMSDIGMGWSADPPRSLQTALDFATEAIKRDDEEGWAYWAMAGYRMFRGQYDKAIADFRKAMELNPNDADVLNDFGWCMSFAGNPQEGIELVQKAMRLNPHYPEYWIMQLGPIYFDARRYADAIATLESLRSLDTVSVQLYLATSHAALGHDEQAAVAAARVKIHDPAASIKKYTSPEMALYQKPSDLEHFRGYLRKAGLPET